MRLKALLFTAGLAVATAGTAAANSQDTCDGKAWLSKIVCKAQHDAAQAQAAPAEETDAFALVRSVLRPRTTFDWFRGVLDQLGNKTMISSSERPSTSPAATSPSDATRRKDGTVEGTRSP
jgi:hypothetical protein